MSGSGGHVQSFSYAQRAPGNVYARLFRVGFTHTYYTQEGGRCRDFSVAPTPTTANLLASLGLVFKDEGAGFSVFFQPRRLPSLKAYIARQAANASEGPEFWTRLTFLMLLQNPSFVGVTALPIGVRQSDVNLYGSNQSAHYERAGRVQAPAAILPPGRFMGAESLYPVAVGETSIDLPPNAKRVTVSDISGAVVLPAPGGDDIVISDAGRGRKRATLNFSILPYDLYTIEVFAKDGKPVSDPAYPRTVVFTPAASGSMALIDMLLTQPTPGAAGVYPIPPMFDRPTVGDAGGIDYRLPFDARSTYWHYYVAPQTRLSRLSGLKIEGPGAAFLRDPDPAPLPDGRLATLFTSETALPLRQKSQQHFRLSGQRRDADGQENAVQISRLPVAPASPVWPGPSQEPVSGTSEMFVYV